MTDAQDVWSEHGLASRLIRAYPTPRDKSPRSLIFMSKHQNRQQLLPVYALGPRVGAYCYNTLHLYASGAALLAAGMIWSTPELGAIGALWLAHAGFDRMLGYGLKLPQGFTYTHLGKIGR
ncbi:MULTISPECIES: DUF4260 family protein [Pseudomonas syringae group]|uniref:DUF4260 family protein n=1 Tax=Pseudomonas coronafaciens pv. coronafaciens TaxID=235275 RepID=A0AAE6QG58_9PSED|nr:MULTISPECIES: DUF4260 family protein [Pseudomonas syringae group]KPZ25295.1 Uncharacterized protein ALO38_00207 [Pseudomonas coronafaciens pv. zizaniae]MCF5745547.1 DUF4260 family protein [Pseudomonas tremae]QGT82044.1 DUF4260 family protein [Pseudomonas coronafaciens pv. coronafaciens]QIQ69826.1 hypothetical protein HBB04_00167 [Pseudomonas coronafaciens]RMO03084.1 hypothetical protein ALQ48_04091 [Pseudomonas coronafaciens pv. zizaniae]